MPNNEEQQEVTYPVYNQFIYKGPITGWVMTGGGSDIDPEDDENVLALLTNYGLGAPLIDEDENIVVDSNEKSLGGFNDTSIYNPGSGNE